MERFKLGQFFTGADKLDRFAGNRFDGKRRATTRVTIRLGQHNPANVQCFVEGLGDVDRILAGHGIGNQ